MLATASPVVQVEPVSASYPWIFPQFHLSSTSKPAVMKH